MNCSDSQIPRNKSLLHDSCLGRYVNAASRKSLEIQAFKLYYHKTKNPFGAKICINIVVLDCS